ncbi:MAG TPA: 16S rRNA (guanine(527)-N(7))-methyltransferase RsmG [Casimicrobiaceae bacterium]|nr:16S rRNA (guanine(527)-N(7))-methyltransferase RsmG [Casimicrobiaceae bacterium]
MTPGGALADGLRALGLELDAAARQKLLAYVALLEKWNRVYNLTAIREPGRMLTHHLLDSLAVLCHLPEAASLRLVDIGSGGGSPGIPLAIARPRWQVSLVERSRKKASFLRQAQAELALANLEIVEARVEDYDPAPLFDAAISRAFSDLADFAAAAERVTRLGARWFAMKGSRPTEEIAALPASVRVIDVPRLSVPGLAAERHVVIMERTA